MQKLSKKYIGITGYNGHIGSRLFSFLKKKKYNVKKVDLSKNQIKTNFKIIIHLASKNNVNESFLKPDFYLKNNILLTLNLLKHIKKNKCDVIYISSYIYKKKNKKIKENDDIKTYNPYSYTKFVSENILSEFKKYFNFNLIVLRVFNVVSVNSPKKSLFGTLIGQIKKDAFKINDPNPERDYLHINDFLNLISRILKSKKNDGIYNVCYGKSYKNIMIAKLFSKYFKKKLIINYKKRKNDHIYIKGNRNKISKEFSWVPKLDIRDFKQFINKK